MVTSTPQREGFSRATKRFSRGPRVPMFNRAVGTVVVASFSFLAAAGQQQAPPAPPARPAPPAQSDVFVGNWRGTVTSSAGSRSPIIVTLVKKGDGYAGSTNGLNATSESALTRVAVIDTKRIAIEAADDSKLGAIVLTGELTVEGNAATGTGTLAVGA